MNKRLEYIYSLIDIDTNGVADIGTDHGFLPVALAERGFTGNIVASDINASPLEKAKENAAKSMVSEKIEFIQCSGLNLIPVEKTNTVIIAGMGGDTICNILDDAEALINDTLSFILQPMSKPEVLRYWLDNNEFQIISDEYIEDNGRIYCVMKAHKSSITRRYSDAELYAGKMELCKNRKLYYKNLLHQKDIFSDILKECLLLKRKSRFIKFFAEQLLSEFDKLILETEYGK